MLKRPLPASAYKFNAWWANESSRKAGHKQALAWLDAGFKAKVSEPSGTSISTAVTGFARSRCD
ncbi:DUF7662 domain-containing protein [Bradyrhizobium sp. McL0616]|uniref:DUF7662 domain-containing protein n=1 Tax=Bradyrhizobium sp. McL0616 TaxID=3415674 RepID=UPI003CEC3BCF